MKEISRRRRRSRRKRELVVGEWWGGPGRRRQLSERRAKEDTAGRGTGSGKFVRQERVLMLLDVNESPK